MASDAAHWTSAAYQATASFVPLLTTKLLGLLADDPGSLSGHSILDLGCGDGVLTARLSRLVGPQGRVLGLDSSPSMIASARELHADPNTTYRVRDCADLASDGEVVAGGGWDVVFSNAALHWILSSGRARERVFDDCFAALKPGGRLVFEMGGKGNVAEVEAALSAALIAEGVDSEAIRSVRPWFFPSDEWIKTCLKKAGFVVEVAELEYRPTKLTTGKGGGLEGLMRLMCVAPLKLVDESRRDAVVARAVAALQSIITREEDSSQWLGYVRLRVAARKP